MILRTGLALAALGLAPLPSEIPPVLVSFPTSDGGWIEADVYGRGGGDRAVVLAHGGRYDKESWARPARELASRGLRVLALNFRGYGKSRGPGEKDPLSAPLSLDVLAAVRYLRQTGARSVSAVGASMGADAAAGAAIEGEAGAIERLVLLAGGAYTPGEKLPGRKLYILCSDDPGPGGTLRLPAIRAQFDRAPQPKELVLLPGAAHAQAIFGTDQGERLLREIARFLTAP